MKRDPLVLFADSLGLIGLTTGPGTQIDITIKLPETLYRLAQIDDLLYHPPTGQLSIKPIFGIICVWTIDIRSNGITE